MLSTSHKSGFSLEARGRFDKKQGKFNVVKLKHHKNGKILERRYNMFISQTNQIMNIHKSAKRFFFKLVLNWLIIGLSTAIPVMT